MKIETLAVIGLVFLLGCGVGDEAPRAADSGAAVENDTEPAILERPFTAEHIRDEWTEGLEIRIRELTEQGESFQTWKVVRSDPEGVEIEAVATNAAGEPVGEASVQRSGWVELRDHATFSAEVASREFVHRDTPLGKLDGWLYTVGSEGSGPVSEFFFAESLPGAPIWVRFSHDGEVVSSFEQIGRSKPTG